MNKRTGLRWRRLAGWLILMLCWTACSPQPAAQAPATDALPSLPTVLPTSPSEGLDLASTQTATPFQPLPPTPTFLPTLLPSPSPSPSPSPTQVPDITLLFTGVIVPGRCVQAGVDAHGDASYIYSEVKDLISQADLAVGTLNATISDYPPHTGCIFTYVLVGSANNADALQGAGFDLMSVATNHIKNCGLGDCGDRAFLDTLDNLRRVGIQPVGAGQNLQDAMQPVVVTLKGIRFGFVSLGEVEPMAFAGDSTPGIAVLTEQNLAQAISDARQVSDVVIAMPHWGPEDSPDPTGDQQRLAQAAVADGADLVIGNHTHVVQAAQEINGVQVFYGLGNFVFDQDWDLAHQQGVILLVHFKGARLDGYELIPTHVDMDGTVHLAGTEESQQILERFEAASQALR